MLTMRPHSRACRQLHDADPQLALWATDKSSASPTVLRHDRTAINIALVTERRVVSCLGFSVWGARVSERQYRSAKTNRPHVGSIDNEQAFDAVSSAAGLDEPMNAAVEGVQHGSLRARRPTFGGADELHIKEIHFHF